jgi:hypothetical protein
VYLDLCSVCVYMYIAKGYYNVLCRPSSLATKVFIGKLPGVRVSRPMMRGVMGLPNSCSAFVGVH